MSLKKVPSVPSASTLLWRAWRRDPLWTKKSIQQIAALRRGTEILNSPPWIKQTTPACQAQETPGRFRKTSGTRAAAYLFYFFFLHSTHKMSALVYVCVCVHVHAPLVMWCSTTRCLTLSLAPARPCHAMPWSGWHRTHGQAVVNNPLILPPPPPSPFSLAR